jgi:mannose-6-phosphate isomerase-like protein (cupin superfamily)
MSKPEQLTKTIVPKLWGYEEWLVNNELYCGKMLHIRPGFKCSLHYHKVKDETFVALEGLVKLEYKLEDGTFESVSMRGEERNCVRIAAGTPHRFWAVDEKSTILEFSTTHSDDDVVRLEDSCEIKPKLPHGFGHNPKVEEATRRLADAIGTEVELEYIEEDEDDDLDDAIGFELNSKRRIGY